jgi:hypothetical protein
MYLRYVLSAAAIFSLAGAAKADYAIEFANSLGVVQNSFMVNQGSSLTIQVYLVQSSSGTGSQTLTTSGLSSAALGLYFSAGTLTTTAANPNSAQFAYSSSNTFNGSAPAPTPPATTPPAGTSYASVSEASSPPVIAPSAGTNANQILLGTFTFTANSSGNITSYFPSSGANDVNGVGTTLDPLVTQGSAAVLVVSAVPEPGSMVLTGLAGTLIGMGAWRKRRKSLAAQVA